MTDTQTKNVAHAKMLADNALADLAATQKAGNPVSEKQLITTVMRLKQIVASLEQVR